MKKELLEVLNFERLIEDIGLTTCYMANMEDDQADVVVHNLLTKYKLDDLFYNTFVSFFGGEAGLAEYIEATRVAEQAVDSIMHRMNDCLVEEVNPYLPDDSKLRKSTLQ